MADNNCVIVQQGFRYLLESLAPYLAGEFEATFNQNWWKEAVWEKLYEEQRRNLPETGEKEELINSLDIQRCLLLFDIHWNDVFRRKLSIDTMISTNFQKTQWWVLGIVIGFNQ